MEQAVQVVMLPDVHATEGCPELIYGAPDRRAGRPRAGHPRRAWL